jgi:hypothetical protein
MNLELSNQELNSIGFAISIALDNVTKEEEDVMNSLKEIQEKLENL